jgi:cell wall-associated NlpC family hydrolase
MSNDIVTEARTYLGVPWVHQGRSRDGVDCLGLAILVAAARRGYRFDLRDYAAQAMDETMQAKCLEHMDPVRLADLASGHIVVIRFENQRHMAIVGDYPIAGLLSLIHANSRVGRVVEHRLDSVWRRLIMSAYALRDLREGA